MKKIMFNDKYGLTKAMLDGRKAQTRRVANLPDFAKEHLDDAFVFGFDSRKSKIIDMYANYKVGEVVAVAQSYDDIYMEKIAPCKEEYRLNAYNKGFNNNHKGWKNKMFVSAEDMPHHIRFTNIRLELLQDISDEDCMKEGVSQIPIVGYYTYDSKFTVYETPREAYAALIDKVSRKGTWDSNPYVFVYDFELID